MSSSCSSEKYFSDIAQEFNNLGFKRIELTGNIKYSEGLEALILQYKSLYNFELMIHNYLPVQPEDFVLNLASCDPGTAERSLRLVERMICLSKKLGKDLYSFHPGFLHELLPEIVDDVFVKASKNCNKREDHYKAVRRIIRMNLEDNFKIAVENLFPESRDDMDSFLCTPEDIEDFIAHFKNEPNVGILLDLGHINITAKKMDFDKFKALEKLFDNHCDRIFAVHLSENDGSGDDHLVTEPDSWQVEYLYGRKRYLKDVPVTFEWRNSASVDSFRKFEVIRKKLEN